MTKRNMDGYQETYEQYEGSGFVFGYNRGRLSKSQVIFEEDIERIQPRKRNNDDTPIFVKCRTCESYMDFRAGPMNQLEGYWQCPDCGVKVREETVYNKLDRENVEFMKRFDEDKDNELEWL